MALCEKYQVPHSEFLSWEEEDQDLAIAYHLYQARFCPQCGTDHTEWEKDRFAYEPELYRCRGCELQELKSEEVQEQGGARGMKIILKKSE